MGAFSFWHILLVVVIILLLLGGNRFSAMMGDVAKGLKTFKSAMADDEEPHQHGAGAAQLPPPQPRIHEAQETPVPGSGETL